MSRLYAVNHDENYVVANNYGEAADKWRKFQLDKQNLEAVQEGEDPKSFEDIDEPEEIKYICKEGDLIL